MDKFKFNKTDLNKFLDKFNYKKILELLKLIYKNYNNSETKNLAMSLTYYSLLALFPLVALVLGITKGFNLDRIVIDKMYEFVPQSEEMVREVLEITNRLIMSTEGSILAGVGILVLLTSVVNLLLMLENSFNKIWHVSKKRSYGRRIVDNVAIIFVGPFILVVLLATNSFVVKSLNKLLFNNTIIVSALLQILNPIAYILLFTAMFYFIPNVNVRLKSALIASVITYILCNVLGTAFVVLQGSITRYNAIYGSLALIPIFLIWVRYIWLTILLGCQISFSIQATDQFLYDERIQMPIRIKKEISLITLALIIKRFKNGEHPYTYMELSKKLGIEVSVIKDVLSELEKMYYVNEIIIDKNEESVYQIGVDPENLYVTDYISNLEEENMEDYDKVFGKLSYEEIKTLERIRENIRLESKVLIKDLYE